MKRVLQVVGGLDVGGLETVAMNCMRLADSAQYRFDFLVLGNPEGPFADEARARGCGVYSVRRPGKRYASFFRLLCAFMLEKGPYDIVHSHVFFTSGLVLAAAKKVGVKHCIAHSHSIERADAKRLDKRVFNSIMRMLMNRSADRYAACSEQAGSYVFGKENFSQRGWVMPNAVNLKKFRFDPEARRRIRTQLDIGQNQIVLGQVGHLAPGKNQEFLLDVFARFSCENEKPVLLLVGDGEMRGLLEQKAEKLGIAGTVRMTGMRMDVPELLSAMDAFVMTSRHEGFGIVIVEAMASGMRCIGEKHAIVAELQALPGFEALDGFDAGEWSAAARRAVLAGRREWTQCAQELREYDQEHLRAVIEDLYRLR